MNILANYLRKQCVQTSLVVLMLLFLLMVGTLFTSTLRAIARGVLPPELLFTELSLRSVDVLSILVPLSFFLGVLFSLSNLYRNQEAVIMHSAGWSLKSMLRALMPLAWVVFVVMLFLSLVVSPKAALLSKELTTKANDEISLMGLTEGKFQKFFSSDGVIFVEKVNVAEQKVENVFANISHDDRIDTDRLTCTGCASDEQVRHLRQIGTENLADCRFTERKWKLLISLAKLCGIDDRANSNERRLTVRDLDTNGPFPGNRGNDPNTACF